MIKKLNGANMDIDLATPADQIQWRQDACPWNEAEKTGEHRCAVKDHLHLPILLRGGVPGQGFMLLSQSESAKR